MGKRYYPAKKYYSKVARFAMFWAAAVIMGIFFGDTVFAKGLNYSGHFFADENPEGEIEQRYLQNVGLSLDHQLSNIFSMREYLRYTNDQDKAEDLTREKVNQGVSLIAGYELFRAEFSAYSEINLSDEDQTLDSELYELRWVSNWGNDLVPSMYFTINTRQQDEGDGTLARGRESNGVIAALDWRRSALSMDYGYRFTQDKPNTGNFVNTRTSHDLKAGYSKSFWQDRLRFQLTENYRISRNEQEALRTGVASNEVNISEVRTGTDNTPADSFEDPSVVPNGLMDDGDIGGNAYTVVDNTTFNTILIALNGNKIDHLYLYTATNITALAAANLTWSAYSNDILGTSWNAVGLLASDITYNSVERRFEIDLGDQTVEYLKLVFDNPLLGPIINFTEIQAFDDVFLTKDSVTFTETDSSITGVSLVGKASEKITLSYRAGFDKSETGTDQTDLASESEELSQSAGITYDSLDRTFSSSLTYVIKTRERLAFEEETSSYSFDLNKDFFPTLSTSAGISKSEISRNSTPLTESTTIRLEGTADIYPDLDLNLRLNFGENNNLEVSSKTTSSSVNATLISRLSPSITMVFRQNYNESGSTINYRTQVAMNWQVSEMLVVSGDVVNSVNERGDLTTDALTYSTNINLALSREALLQLDYSSTSGGDATTDSGDVSLNWYPDNWGRFEFGCLYQRAPSIVDNFYRIYGQVDVNFKIP